MPAAVLELEFIEKEIDLLITRINAAQAEALSLRIAAAYIAGSRSITSTIYSSDKKKLSDLQERAIKRLSAEHFGYIHEFNNTMGEQLKDKARELLQQEKGYKDIADYTRQVLDGSENVVINHVGQTRKIIQIGKDGKLRQVEKTITRPYITNTKAYSDMLARTATHTAWEEGRAAQYQKMGFKMWRFAGPIDSRSRPDHAAVVGNVYEYGTPESDLAQQLLHEPNCRHRQIVFFNDPDLDTPQEFYDKQKQKAGLRYDDDSGWVFGDLGDAPKTYPGGVPKPGTDRESLETIIHGHEDKIRNRKTEKGIVFDGDGNVVFEKSGTKNRIVYTDEEVKSFKGRVFTHNHPRSTSFSDADIRTACMTGLKEVRVAGAKRSYVMTMADDSDFNQGLWDDTMKQAVKYHNEEVKGEFLSKIAAGDMTVEEAEFTHWHTIWSRIARDIARVEYTMIEEV